MIVKISILRGNFKRNEKSWTTCGSQTRQPNSRIKNLSWFYLRATYDTPTQIHMDLHFFLFFRFSQHRNSRAAMWYWRRHHNIKESVFPFPNFSDSVLFFFTVRSNTFIYFLIKVDLCTSCDKPEIALFFYSITSMFFSIHFSFLHLIFLYFYVHFYSFIFFYIIFFLLSKGVITN